MTDPHGPEHPAGGTGTSGDSRPEVTTPVGSSPSPEQATSEAAGAGSGGGPGDGAGASAPGRGAEAPAGSDDIDDVDQQAIDGDIEELVAKNQEYLDLVRRTQADFENYRKRAQKQQDDAVVRELGGFVERLLPVLDACDAAATQGAADAVEPIVSALFGALEREGLERIEPKGEPFDPTVAEAVVHEPGEGGAQIVADVLRAGYRWRGRLLRPALVKVTD
jgi:molecular chaperone GrpE